MMQYEYIDPDEQIASPDFQVVKSFLKDTKRTQVGWHYVTDLVWIYRKIKNWPRGLTILDAGGGNGPVQFLLLEMGFHVVNIDLVPRILPIAFKKRYGCECEKLFSYQETSYRRFIQTPERNPFINKVKQTPAYQVLNWIKKPPFWYARACEMWRKKHGIETPHGSLKWITGNLCKIPEIPTHFFEGVVSLSSIEHIPYDTLFSAWRELERVLKPDSGWAVTTSASSRSERWFHEPSQGWCYSKEDFQNLFHAKPLNDNNPEMILRRYADCKYLRENLADFYKKSGRFGMPWGIWDPKYVPVGISKEMKDRQRKKMEC